METIRLTNFRSLMDTGRIELRPLTILVGANSSGKSSFLRFFPLLRQTYLSTSKSPLLWFSSTGDVDFGDFSTVLRRNEDKVGEENLITIQGVLGGRGIRIGRGRVMPSPRWNVFRNFSVSLRGDHNSTKVSQIVLHDEFNNLTINISASGKADVCWKSPARTIRGELAVEFIGGLFPVSEYIGRRVVAQQIASSGVFTSQTTSTVAELIERWTTHISSPKDEPIEQMWAELGFQPEVSKTQAMVEAVEKYLMLGLVTEVLEHASNALRDYSHRIRYLAPFRREPIRYYRHEEQVAEQIEPHGENLAMMMRALSQPERESLSNFVLAHLDIGIELDDSKPPHVAIMIRDRNDRLFNLTDMGFGYSQVLPVLAQCWMTYYGVSDVQTPSLLAIEQPELHLHPALQAKLGDLFATIVNLPKELNSESSRRDVETQLLVETHSQSLIDRLGELICDGKLSLNDVQVLLFEKNSKTGSTQIRTSEFNKSGILQNWPVGFLSALGIENVDRIFLRLRQSGFIKVGTTVQ